MPKVATLNISHVVKKNDAIKILTLNVQDNTIFHHVEHLEAFSLVLQGIRPIIFSRHDKSS
jgi:hypothetical protein